NIDGPFALLHPSRGLSAQRERWPAAGFIELARALRARDPIPLLVTGTAGAPTVGIFALQSDEPDRWAPIGPHTAVVRAVYPCPPGHRKETCPDFACVRHLDIACIERALDGLLAPISER